MAYWFYTIHERNVNAGTLVTYKLSYRRVCLIPDHFFEYFVLLVTRVAQISLGSVWFRPQMGGSVQSGPVPGDLSVWFDPFSTAHLLRV